MKHKILRIFKIWEQRGVYGEEFITDLSGLISASPPSKKIDETHEFQVMFFYLTLEILMIFSLKNFRLCAPSFVLTKPC